MNTLLFTIHILACITLIILVLLQSGHQGMGVIFGGSSSSLFGSSGAGGFLTKMTIAAAVVFLLTSISFTYLSAPRQGPNENSIIQQESGQQAQPQTQGAPPGSEQPETESE